MKDFIAISDHPAGEIQDLLDLAVGFRIEGGAGTLCHPGQQVEAGLLITSRMPFKKDRHIPGYLPIRAKQPFPSFLQCGMQAVLNQVASILPFHALQVGSIQSERLSKTKINGCCQSGD